MDAPCSGLGTIRRDPDIKWRRTEEEFPRFQELQVRILAGAARALRPGGRLLYATCSSEPDENEAVVARVLGEGVHLREEPIRTPAAVPLVNERGHLRTLPFRDGLEAFFAASLVNTVDLR